MEVWGGERARGRKEDEYSNGGKTRRSWRKNRNKGTSGRKMNRGKKGVGHGQLKDSVVKRGKKSKMRQKEEKMTE